MTIRRKLTASYVGILLLMSCNVLIRVWGDSKRGAAFEDLTGGISRQTLVSSIQQQLGDYEKRVTPLSHVTEAGAASSREERSQIIQRLDSIEKDVQHLAALAPPEDKARLDSLLQAFQDLNTSWTSLGETRAMAAVVSRTDALSRRVTEEILPDIQETEKTRQAPATAHFHEVTKLGGPDHTRCVLFQRDSVCRIWRWWFQAGSSAASAS